MGMVALFVVVRSLLTNREFSVDGKSTAINCHNKKTGHVAVTCSREDSEDEEEERERLRTRR